LKKIISFQKRIPPCDLEKLYAQRQRVPDNIEEKIGAIECDSGNVKVQWNNVKECVLDTISDLFGKAEKTARKPCITEEFISKLNEWMKVGNGSMSILKKAERSSGG
jgi:hypothetical protein